MAHLAVLEEDPRLLAARSGELEHRGRAAHALQLNDIRDVEIAQRSLEFLAFLADRPVAAARRRDRRNRREGMAFRESESRPGRLLVSRCAAR